MNWNEYVDHIRESDPDAYQLLDEAKAEAAVISAMIKQRNTLGLSQRELASMCEMPQSSVARIESGKATPKLDTLLKIFKQLGLTVTVSPIQSAGYTRRK